MANSAERMAAHTQLLKTYLPAQDKPITEVAIFELKHPQSPETLRNFEQRIIANCQDGKGIKRMAWGFSLTDEKKLVWMLDWDKIQDHWDFWQTPAFTPVIQAIEDLFVEGRPLVRHYEFDPPGMLNQEYQRVLIWNQENRDIAAEQVLKSNGPTTTSTSIASNGAYAVDMDEDTWWCSNFGYTSEAEVRKDSVQDKGEAGIFKLKFSDTK
ncbi:hypothetical protein COCMIDRAFT_3607 [Bipolaris oryzae ATCC 44560]|uniref:ABM domain-containing protein n=1 Tax=Bipolaris oryzae ATCC 44560 TaxID=930090 RepID=W6ZC21_COCMI|nr:uncharacterized protein COCMIDRAFT_3607 [Bipolaris oryzae ATCC 44560]EUC47348.1 hypothetical protein COCMIDRAFT_3607 [Bipolaris oryzae ATCC 44560]